LQEEVEDLADRVEQANNALRGDWSLWRTRMRADLKSAFISTAVKNVDYYEKVRLRGQWNPSTDLSPFYASLYPSLSSHFQNLGCSVLIEAVFCSYLRGLTFLVQ
ncbi:hypothetical protein ILYODFUR_035248, partial [Ilyodon furcidens]